MSKIAKKHIECQLLLVQAKTEGYSFNLYDDVWSIDINSKIRVYKITSKINNSLREGFLKTLAHYAQYNSPSTAMLCSYILKYFFIFMDYSEKITEQDLIAFQNKNQNKKNYGTYLKSFFKTWYELGYPGVDKKLYNFILSWGNFSDIRKAGDVIKRKDPIQGPLTDAELQGFNEAALRAYERGSISLSDYTMALLVSHTGRRTLQITQMKVSDIIKAKNSKGEVSYLLKIPRIKQKNDFRELFRTFRITGNLYDLLQKQAQDSIEIVSQHLNRVLNNDEKQLVPLFVSTLRIRYMLDNNEKDDIFTSDKIHFNTLKIARLVRKILAEETVISERTAKPLHASPRRFRYTLGTRAAREGAGAEVISELLDHTSPQHAGVYIQNNADYAYKIDQIVGEELFQYSKIFQGEVIEHIDDDIHASRRIRDLDGDDAGQCNQCSSCSANVPVPCYTCISFRPWLDARHELIYIKLVEERRTVLDLTKDSRVAESLDRTILAVEEVIKKCEEIKNGRLIK
ncbi:site-specific integrase [Escherichia coli]|uniref:site-specific integrase n=1 Tax=Escherichia coli TaxID=562 RepID=UPI000D0B88B3|nr:site-specific integrase [Escherichia coli]MDL4693823.1 site-specific integrase [Escherichia coli]MDL4697924.1 site-specific integrase [Escherichia coli]PSG46250.1 hypothetical protein C6969_23530 [Escherichia coli]QCT10962.1 hypothetical protein FEV15_06310 [Escherichia coli]HAG9074090.1 tyrosine-type recombinase/integrase [Escherichia coli]